MSTSPDTSEDAAARHVVAVMGGSYSIHDTGDEAGQYDVHIATGDGLSVALEVTSFGGDDWRQTAARVRAETDKGNFHGDGLRQHWWVVFQSGIGIREIEAPLQNVLERLEAGGYGFASDSYDGGDATLADIARVLRELQVSEVVIWPDSHAGEPRILLSQSNSLIGTAGALPAALTAVFDKEDNQDKLARADADERHLYVFMEHDGASAVLEGAWPLPPAPPDPAGVVDVLWVYSASASYHVFRTRPGSAAWERFVSVTGEPG